MKLRFSMRIRHFLEGYIFISLWVIGFLAFMAVPLGRSLYFAFHELKVTAEGLKASYVGWKQFQEAFTLDVKFPSRLISTITSLFLEVPLILIFAIFIAILLNRHFTGRGIFRGIFFLPVIVSSGAVLQRLQSDGGDRLPIFSQYNLVDLLRNVIPVEILRPLLEILDSLTVVMWDSGVQILIFLAGLQAISVQLYEAAKCDGATPWESFWKITFPLLMPMMLVNTLFSIVNSFTKRDNQVMEYIQSVFNLSKFGYASALGWIYFLVIFVIIGIVFYIFRNKLSERG